MHISKELLFDTYQKTDLPKEWMRSLYRDKLFKLFVPRSYGGLELTLDEGLLRIYEMAEIHGSLGWAVNLGAGAGYFWSFFDHETAQEIFAPDNAVIAGSGQKTGEMYNNRINGKWAKCTGAGYATWFTANVVLENGHVSSFAIPRHLVEILPSWNLFALKATSSFSIEIFDTFVDDRYLFTIGEIKNTNTELYSVSQVPFDPFARLCMTSALLGMTSCFIGHLNDEFKNIDEIISHSKGLKQKLNQFRSGLFEQTRILNESPSENLKIDVSEFSKSIYNSCTKLFYQHGMKLGNESYLSHYA